jgi:hypothetical protein
MKKSGWEIDSKTIVGIGVEFLMGDWVFRFGLDEIVDTSVWILELDHLLDNGTEVGCWVGWGCGSFEVGCGVGFLGFWLELQLASAFLGFAKFEDFRWKLLLEGGDFGIEGIGIELGWGFKWLYLFLEGGVIRLLFLKLCNFIIELIVQLLKILP